MEVMVVGTMDVKSALHINHSHAFNGAQERWADWAFSFKRAVRSQGAAVYRQLIGIEVEEDFDENL
jgi:hypothetical protein